MKPHVWIIDDEPGICASLGRSTSTCSYSDSGRVCSFATSGLK